MTPKTNGTPVPTTQPVPISNVNAVVLTFRGRAVPPALRGQVLGALLALRLLSEVRMTSPEGDEVTFDGMDAPSVAHAMSFVRVDNLAALGAHLARLVE